jgi:hypothetical protein
MLGTSGFYDTGLAAMVTGAVAFGFRTKGEEKANNPEKAKFYCFEYAGLSQQTFPYLTLLY